MIRLRVEEHISQMKKKEKLDEFNLKNHAQNMASVISYAMEYFNNYTYELLELKAITISTVVQVI